MDASASFLGLIPADCAAGHLQCTPILDGSASRCVIAASGAVGEGYVPFVSDAATVKSAIVV